MDKKDPDFQKMYLDKRAADILVASAERERLLAIRSLIEPCVYRTDSPAAGFIRDQSLARDMRQLYIKLGDRIEALTRAIWETKREVSEEVDEWHSYTELRELGR